MVYLDDDLPNHPKILRAGAMLDVPNGAALALALYVGGLAYTRKYLTDGFIPDGFLTGSPLFGMAVEETCGKPVQKTHVTRSLRDTPRDKREFAASSLRVCCALDVAKALVDRRVKLWHATRGGYRIHDYHHMNESADKAKHRRELARERKRRERAKKDGHPAAVTRDMSQPVTQVVTRDTPRDPTRARPTAHCPLRTSTPSPRRTSDHRSTTEQAPRVRAKRTDPATDQQLVRLAHDVLETADGESDFTELKSRLKDRCAAVGFVYDANVVGDAIECAIAQRSKAS